MSWGQYYDDAMSFLLHGNTRSRSENLDYMQAVASSYGGETRLGQFAIASVIYATVKWLGDVSDAHVAQYGPTDFKR